MKPIYIPTGKAKEYGDYAINIYTGCPHQCFYCFAPSVLRREKETFHSCISPRDGILEALRQQLKREQITGKTIHLCFTCDPYPSGCDSSTTREIIKILKNAGNHVQILTKNGKEAMRDFDLLDHNDWFGITYAGYNPGEAEKPPEAEPFAGPWLDRLRALKTAYDMGIKTWISAEPVLNAADVLDLIECADYVNLWKVGKLNYHPSDIDWKAFGERAERALLARKRRNPNVDYYIKESLRTEMERGD